MKKFLISGILILSSMAAMAGGYVTNTNMSVAYLRNPAREGAIDVDGVYFNPAGTAFLSNGIHAYVSLQTAIQERKTDITFAPFRLNKDHLNEASRPYKGTTLAPVIPAIYLAYNWDRWNVQAAFNIVGGGGKAKYKEGIGQFEALVAGGVARQATDGSILYNMNQSITGESYQFGFYLGTSYEIIKEHLAVSLGVKGVYCKNHYDGELTGINGYMPATKTTFPLMDDITLDATQKGFSATPIIGIDYQVNSKLNLSFRYQMRTYLKLKTDADNKIANPAVEQSLANFSDGKKLRSDIPGYFLFGVQYAPIEPLRLAASYRYFDEKHATRDMVANEANKNNKGTHEVCAGVEWDIFKYLTFSCGYQGCSYQQSDEELSELDFQLSSNSILAGFRVNISDHWKIDLGYMHTIYIPKTITQQMRPDGSLPYKTRYDRENNVFGLGLTCSF